MRVKKPPMALPATRTANLKQVLTDHRRQILDSVRGRVREERDQRPTGIRDSVDASDATFQTEIDMALLEMQAATLSRIDEALARLEAGEYGACFECAGPIAESRLKALPFAVRCRACEEQREDVRGRARHATLRAATPFANTARF